MAADAKTIAEHLGDAIQSPNRSGKTRGFRSRRQDVNQLLFILGIQLRFAPSATGSAQSLLPALGPLVVPAHNGLAADLGAPGHFRLRKTFFQ